jgi:hypothetical protein
MSRAPEPPYGTALLVAGIVVAVGVTAVASVTVFGVGDRLRAERTNGSFAFERTDATYRVGPNGTVTLDAVALTYERGPPLAADRLEVRVNDGPAYAIEAVRRTDGTETIRAVPPFADEEVDPGANGTVAIAPNGSVAPGDQIGANGTAGSLESLDVEPGDTVRVVYDGPERRYVVDSYEVAPE